MKEDTIPTEEDIHVTIAKKELAKHLLRMFKYETY